MVKKSVCGGSWGSFARSSYEFEHGIDILGWNGYAIILDVEKTML